VSPREHEAAQQMQQLHRGFGVELQESRDRPAPSAQLPYPTAGATAQASRQLYGRRSTKRDEALQQPASPQPDLEAEREEYEDEGSDEEGET
jgi:hypothetical protein